MFEFLRFEFNAAGMMFGLNRAKKAQQAGNNQVALKFFRNAVQLGHAAMAIQSKKISTSQRVAVTQGITFARAKYCLLFVNELPPDDRVLLLSVVHSWSEIQTALGGGMPDDQMLRMFTIAKSRLDSEKNVISIIYDNDNVPAPLRKIMQSFIKGEITQEETEQQLDACTAKLQKWIQKLFPERPPIKA